MRLIVATAVAMWCVTGFAQAGVAAQAADAKLPDWDVISVKPAQMPCGQNVMQPTGDGVRMCITVQGLVKYVFRITEDSRILNAPEWMKQASYSIDAKVSSEDAAAYAKLSGEPRRAMLQKLLADRFELKCHRETRELPIYALMIAKGGLKMKEARPEEASSARMRARGRGEIEGIAETIDSTLPTFLTQELNRPVVNKTGLTGKYDFILKFQPGQSTETDSEGASIFTAIQEQLGLKLEPTKGPLEVIIIDHIEKPSAN
jgi:uncharacterized protein (TIGR03435 family)